MVLQPIGAADDGVAEMLDRERNGAPGGIWPEEEARIPNGTPSTAEFKADLALMLEEPSADDTRIVPVLDDSWIVENPWIPRAPGVPMSAATKFSDEEMEHYRAVQPPPEMRNGMAQFYRQILAFGDWFDELEAQVKTNLASKPVLLVWGMKDMGFRPKVLTWMKRVRPCGRGVTSGQALHPTRRSRGDHRSHHRPIRVTLIWRTRLI